MKYLIFALYFLITWFHVIIMNAFILLWYFDFKHFNPYGYYHLRITDMRSNFYRGWLNKIFYEGD